LEPLQVSGDERLGANIVKRALEEPARQLACNAGEEGSVVVEKIKVGEGPFGYDAERGEYGDLIASGVIDPTKVARSALQNAASVAALMLMTECMVADRPEEKEPVAPAMPPGGGMY
jgi:chaperonin GroEL